MLPFTVTEWVSEWVNEWMSLLIKPLLLLLLLPLLATLLPRWWPSLSKLTLSKVGRLDRWATTAAAAAAAAAAVVVVHWGDSPSSSSPSPSAPSAIPSPVTGCPLIGVAVCLSSVQYCAACSLLPFFLFLPLAPSLMLIVSLHLTLPVCLLLSFFLFFVCLPTYLLQLHRTTLLFVVATRLHQCDGAKCSSTTLNFSGGGRGSVQDPLVTV